MSGTDELDESEQWAATVVELFLGAVRHCDVPGAGNGMHDFEADLPDGVAAIEVTGYVDAHRRALLSNLGKAAAAGSSTTAVDAHPAESEETGAAFILADSPWLWVVRLVSTARVRDVTEAKLAPLLRRLETLGVRSLLGLPRSEIDLARDLSTLGVEHVLASGARHGREGVVLLRGGTSGGRSWRADDLDEWLTSLFATPQIEAKIAKLARAEAAQRHLMIVTDPESDAGFGLSLSLRALASEGAAPFELPTFTPPASLSKVWILTRSVTSEPAPGGVLGLVCTATGWELLGDPRD